MATELTIKGSVVVGIVGEASGVITVNVPTEVDAIGDRAFFRCSGLTSLTLPETIHSIGDRAFYSCSPGRLGRPTLWVGRGGAIPPAGRIERKLYPYRARALQHRCECYT